MHSVIYGILLGKSQVQSGIGVDEMLLKEYGLEIRHEEFIVPREAFRFMVDKARFLSVQRLPPNPPWNDRLLRYRDAVGLGKNDYQPGWYILFNSHGDDVIDRLKYEEGEIIRTGGKWIALSWKKNGFRLAEPLECHAVPVIKAVWHISTTFRHTIHFSARSRWNGSGVSPSFV